MLQYLILLTLISCRGKVTGIGLGEATIYAVSANGQIWATCEFTVVEDLDTISGDLNYDNSLTVTDVVLLRKAILASKTVQDEPAGDMNEDDRLTVTDVVLLRKAILSADVK